MATITGTVGDDTLTGTVGNDTFDGLDGNDTLAGGAGDDILAGGAGNDTADYSHAPSGVTVNLVTGTASGGDGNDTLSSIEAITGSIYADTLTGDDGNNTFNALRGGDTLFGGAGIDGFDFFPISGNFIADGGSGEDVAFFFSEPNAIYLDLVTGMFTNANGNGVISDIEIFYFGRGADTFVGDSGDNIADGGFGDDILSGGAGNDTLNGDRGSDTLTGGPGNDSLKGGADAVSATNTDTAIYSGNFADYLVAYSSATGVITMTDKTSERDGIDEVREVEVFRFADSTQTAAAVIAMAGVGQPPVDTTAPNVISFNPASASSSVAVGSNIVATFSEAVARGTGTVQLKNAAGLTVESYDAATSSNLSFAGSALTINPTADLAAGTGYRIEFASGSVKDTAGNAYTGGSDYTFTTAGTAPVGADPVFGTPGDDVLTGGSQDDIIHAGAGSDTVQGNAGNDQLFGEAGNDTLLGGDGNDMLDGGTGDDRMEGGKGADTYYVDSADDLVVEADNALSSAPGPRAGLDLGNAIDKVITNVNYSLTAFVENLSLAAGSGGLSGTGNALDNLLAGNEANNTLTGLGGNDAIDGGAGRDTAAYSAARSGYTLTKTSSGFTVADTQGSEGSDTLQNVERLKFADISTALDLGLSESGGGAALLIGAVLGSAALTAKKDLVGAVIGLFDQGFTLQQLSGAVMRLDIWGTLAAGGNPGASNSQIATYLLTTANGSAPDTATLNTATAALDGETSATQGDFLWQLAQSASNQAQVNLVGLTQTGLEFVA